MSVPKFFEFFTPTLRALDRSSPIKAQTLQEQLASDLHLTEEDKAEMLPSGRQATYKNRIYWSITYLKNAGLVTCVGRGLYEITDLGRQCLANDADIIDLHYLERFNSFVEFHKAKSPSTDVQSIETIPSDETPIESSVLIDSLSLSVCQQRLAHLNERTARRKKDGVYYTDELRAATAETQRRINEENRIKREMYRKNALQHL